MTYILIIMWIGSMSNNSGKAAISVEFNTKEACMEAARAIQQQNSSTSVVVCAAKGERK